MKATYTRYILNFKRPSGTSRGILEEKETWFILLEKDGKQGIGECGLLRGLSIDDVPEFEEKLKWVCENIQLGFESLFSNLEEFPSIQFGLEQAFLSLNANHPFLPFPSHFVNQEVPISINGLIWMGDKAFMLSQLEKKLEEGFQCIKMKIGAIDFDAEISILSAIRGN